MTIEAFNAANFDQPFNDLIPILRPPEAIHPDSSKSFEDPNKEIPPLALTESDSYHEIAWESLRRNRFYQALVDRRKKLVPASTWGFRWSPTVERTHGLVRIKPYWESYSENTPPAWVGFDSFAERLPHSVSSKTEVVSLSLDPGQVAVVFDLAGLISGQSTWDIQVWAARERLQELCEGSLKSEAINGKPPHKKVLIRRLKLFDLLSQGRTLYSASSELKYRQKRGEAKTANKAIDPFASSYLQLGNKEPVTTAFEDATEAYSLVYRHGYVGLLRGERDYVLEGQRLVPYTIRYNEEERKATASTELGL